MKKLVALILLISCVLACSMLAGCISAKSDKTTVVFYHTMGQNLRTVLQKYIAEFNKIHPEIVIDEQSIGGYDDVRDQVINELQQANSRARILLSRPRRDLSPLEKGHRLSTRI
jgi:ABC-type glycerol-3-phosphate transport system substrate-binding protein